MAALLGESADGEQGCIANKRLKSRVNLDGIGTDELAAILYE